MPEKRRVGSQEAESRWLRARSRARSSSRRSYVMADPGKGNDDLMQVAFGEFRSPRPPARIPGGGTKRRNEADVVNLYRLCSEPTCVSTVATNKAGLRPRHAMCQ